MFSEEFLMNIVTFELKITALFRVKPLKWLSVVISLGDIVYIVNVCLSSPIDNLFDFVKLSSEVILVFMLVINVITACFASCATDLYHDISELQLQGLNNTDNVLAVLLAFKWLSLIPCVILNYLMGRDVTFGLLVIGIWDCMSRIVNIPILKRLVVKRLRIIRTLAESETNLDQVVTGVRELLKFNSRINHAFGAFAAIYTACSFTRFLLIFYNTWFIYGLGESVGVPIENNIYYTTSYVIWLSSALLLVMFSSFVTDEVDEIKYELDVTMTARPCSKQNQKMISLLLLELHHQPIQFSPLGLFVVNRSSLAVVIATLISYMLVFIQFS